MKLFRLWFCIVLLLPSVLLAHGDEDHGSAPAVPASPAAQALRVEATSELFEVVGVLDGGKFVMHLDRFASNEPVADAKISVEGGALQATVAVEHDGIYTAAAAGLAAPGTHPLVFTIQAGEVSDLLTGDLVVPGPAAAAAHTDTFYWRSNAWLALLTLVAALILGASAIAWRRRRTAQAGAFQ
ncbi:MAG: hypothetical protein K2Q07_06725 [Burkholderiaceae bacterium]|nr:hypothetical protein [Burkholderiaceae bacterium]